MEYPKPPPRQKDPGWLGLLAQLPCVVCGSHPVVLHHVIMGRYAQRRSDDRDAIPLCPDCHHELHKSPEGWRERHGPDHDFLTLTRLAVGALKRRTI